MKFKNQYLYCNIRNKIAFNIIMESKISDRALFYINFEKGVWFILFLQYWSLDLFLPFMYIRSYFIFEA